jgi:hypothetical protein
MVSKEPTRGYQDYSTNQTLRFDGCVKVNESLHT